MKIQRKINLKKSLEQIIFRKISTFIIDSVDIKWILLRLYQLIIDFNISCLAIDRRENESELFISRIFLILVDTNKSTIKTQRFI